MSGNIDSIRRNARQLAWQYYDGSSRNYNPFARTSKGQFRKTDEEEATSRQPNVADPVGDEKSSTGQAPLDHPNSTQADYPQADHTLENKEVAQSNPSSKTTTNEEAQKNGEPVRRRGKISKILHMGKGRSEDKEAAGKRSGKRAYKKIPFMQQVKATVFGSWINILLICVPIGFAVRYTIDGVASFVVNFIAIIPLAAMLSFATEELAMYTGETLGGLLNASFGNATELIVSIIALKQRKILIVQTSLIGSMLSNLLLVLGMCFYLGGINRVKQHFNITVAQTASSLLALSIGSLIIPTAFLRFGSENGTDENGNTARSGIAPISRGTSVILLVVYASYLYFQLKTHVDMYNEPSKKVEKRKGHGPEKGDTQLGVATMGAGTAASMGGTAMRNNPVQKPEHLDDDEDEGETPSLSLVGSLVTLTISTVLIAFMSDYMVSGIDAISGKVPQEFIGLILIPIVGNAAEHATAVTVAIKDKMDLAIGVAIGSSMQIALLIIPLMIVISWCGLGQPADLTLGFDGFQVTVLFIAVLLVNYLIQDGESHWLEGVLLCSTYLIIAVSSWFYPVQGMLWRQSTLRNLSKKFQAMLQAKGARDMQF